MCSIGYDPADIYSERIVTAKKKHFCEECCRNIEVGEKYQYVFGKWGGVKKPTIFKTCSHCLVAQKWLLAECNGFIHGALQDEIWEHADEYRKRFLWRWVAGMKRKWKKFKSDQLMEIKNGGN